MAAMSLYSLINSICIYLFYTDLCLPHKITVELDSFFRMIDGWVTYELWLIPVFCYFWPTLGNK